MCSLQRVTLSLAAASAHHSTLSPQVRLEALIGVGFDLSGALDEYGQSAVFPQPIHMLTTAPSPHRCAR